MKRWFAIFLCLVLLTIGLIRTGVGVIVIGEAQSWWTFGGEAAQAVAETAEFISNAPNNLLGFSVLGYFLYLLAMGLALIAGATAQIWRARWGMTLIIGYLAAHAFLFINFATINPKVGFVAAVGVVAALLGWANRDDPQPSSGGAAKPAEAAGE